MSWWYSWVVCFRRFPYLAFITKFEPLCGLKKIFFQYCVCVRSFEHFCVGRKMFCSTVTVGDHFPRIVFSLVKQKVSERQEQNKYL